MSAQWQVHATLDDTPNGLRLELHATRIVDGVSQTSHDVVMVDHAGEARAECAHYAALIGAEGFTLEDRRKSAA